MSTQAVRLHIEAERALLGAALHDPRVSDRVATLSSDAFESSYHQALREAIVTARREVETTTIDPADWMREVGHRVDMPAGRDGHLGVALAQTMQAACEPRAVGAHVRMVAEAGTRRDIMAIARRLAQTVTSAEPHNFRDLAQQARAALTPARESYYRATGHSPADRPDRNQIAELIRRAETTADAAEQATGDRRRKLAAELRDLLRGLVDVIRQGREAAGRATAAGLDMQSHRLPPNPDSQWIGARELAARQRRRRQAARDDRAARGEQSASATPTFEAEADLGDSVDDAVDQHIAKREQAERALLVGIAYAGLDSLEHAGFDPDQMAATWRRDVVELARELHARGEPTDALTLTWQARQAGITDADGSEIDTGTLYEQLRTQDWINPAQHARDIETAADHIAAGEAARDALAAADDPTADPEAVMDQLDVRMAALALNHRARELGGRVTAHQVDRGHQAQREDPRAGVAIDPNAPIEQTAQTVVNRIRARNPSQQVASDQVDRVLQRHYAFAPDTARRVADHAAQLAARRREPGEAPRRSRPDREHRERPIK